MENRSILAAFGHPDDEAFGTGGTLAYYGTKGVPITLVCATSGEAGEIADPALATPENLGAVRQEELRCAAQTLSVAELIFLGYRDSGMAGTVENKDPRAFMNAPADEVVRRLVEIMRSKRPTVVITFEPEGGYGHPDHMAIHRHTAAAFHAAADPSRYPDLGPKWQAARLFYTAIPRSFFQELRARIKAMGIDTSEFDKFEESGEMGWPDDQIHCTIDVSDQVDTKWSALECHRTQFGQNNLFHRLPDAIMKEMIGREYFALAWPAPSAGVKFTDLFEGL